MKQIFKYIAIILIVAVVSSGVTWYAKPTEEEVPLDVVVYALEWSAAGYPWHVGAYVAYEKGWFEENGIAITIQRGYGSSDTVKRIASGTATFGVADMSTMISLKSNEGLEVKAIGAMFHSWPLSTLTLAGSGINEPKDLEGRTLGEDAGSEVHVLFPAYCKVVGIDIEKVNIVTIAPSAIYSSLAVGDVDAINGWNTVTVYLEPEFDIDINALKWSDYGFSLYSHCLHTSEALIEENPDLVQRFVDALYRGIQWSIENKEEAMDIFQSYHPESVREYDMGRFDLSVELMDDVISTGATGKGLGLINREKLQMTRDTLVEYLELPTVPALDDIYTDQFCED